MLSLHSVNETILCGCSLPAEGRPAGRSFEEAGHALIPSDAKSQWRFGELRRVILEADLRNLNPPVSSGGAPNLTPADRALKSAIPKFEFEYHCAVVCAAKLCAMTRGINPRAKQQRYDARWIVGVSHIKYDEKVNTIENLIVPPVVPGVRGFQFAYEQDKRGRWHVQISPAQLAKPAVFFKKDGEWKTNLPKHIPEWEGVYVAPMLGTFDQADLYIRGPWHGADPWTGEVKNKTPNEVYMFGKFVGRGRKCGAEARSDFAERVLDGKWQEAIEHDPVTFAYQVRGWEALRATTWKHRTEPPTVTIIGGRQDPERISMSSKQRLLSSTMCTGSTPVTGSGGQGTSNSSLSVWSNGFATTPAEDYSTCWTSSIGSPSTWRSKDPTCPSTPHIYGLPPMWIPDPGSGRTLTLNMNEPSSGEFNCVFTEPDDLFMESILSTH